MNILMTIYRMLTNSRRSSLYRKIHRHSIYNEVPLSKSKICGCFSCIRIYTPAEIKEWIDEPQVESPTPVRTAECPFCGIDAVLPESDKYEITIELLKAMNSKYFTNAGT